MSGRGEAGSDWAAVIDRVVDGDRQAFLELAHLVTGFLAELRAYDFRDEWPDLIQEVVLALIGAAREGRIRERAAAVGYVRQVTRFKFLDRLEQKERRRERETDPIDDAPPLAERPESELRPRDEVVVDIRRALEKLPEPRRSVVYAVYGEGKTYDQVVEETGIPLGSVKRYLRQGLAALREIYGEKG